MKKLKYRIFACFKILFGREKHWMIVRLDDDNLVRLIKDETFECSITYHGMQPYNYKSLIRYLSNSIDDIELICDKAKYEADSIEYKKSKKV